MDGGSLYNFGFYAGEPAYQFSEELQAHYDGHEFHGTVGVYYFTEKDNYSPATVVATGQLLNVFVPQVPPRDPSQFFRFLEAGGLLETESEAIFAQGTYDLVGGFSATAGIRYSYEHKKLFERFALSFDDPYAAGSSPVAPVEQPAQTFTSTTPKIGLQYQMAPEVMAYATYSKGFKAGGFDTGSLPAARFQPETLTAYEVGLKSTWLDKRLRADVDGFFYRYNDLQVTQIVGLLPTTDNAATARIYGLEAELTARVIDPMTISGYLSWLHARYLSYFGVDPVQPLLPGNVDFSGNHLNNAPDFSAHLSAEYTWQIPGGTLAARVEGDYSSAFYFAPDNSPYLSQGAYTKGNAFITYNNDSKWYSTVFVRNISNAATKTSALVNSALAGNPVQGALAPPRTFGLELGYRF